MSREPNSKRRKVVENTTGNPSFAVAAAGFLDGDGEGIVGEVPIVLDSDDSQNVNGNGTVPNRNGSGLPFNGRGPVPGASSGSTTNQQFRPHAAGQFGSSSSASSSSTQPNPFGSTFVQSADGRRTFSVPGLSNNVNNSNSSAASSSSAMMFASRSGTSNNLQRNASTMSTASGMFNPANTNTNRGNANTNNNLLTRAHSTTSQFGSNNINKINNTSNPALSGQALADQLDLAKYEADGTDSKFVSDNKALIKKFCEEEEKRMKDEMRGNSNPNGSQNQNGVGQNGVGVVSGNGFGTGSLNIPQSRGKMNHSSSAVASNVSAVASNAKKECPLTTEIRHLEDVLDESRKMAGNAQFAAMVNQKEITRTRWRVAQLKNLQKWGEKRREKARNEIEAERERKEEKRREEKRKKEERRREEKKRKEERRKEEKEREREKRNLGGTQQTQDGDHDRHDKKKKKKRSHHHSSSQRTQHRDSKHGNTQNGSQNTQKDRSSKHKKDKKERRLSIDEGEDHLSYNNHDNVLNHDFSGYCDLRSVRQANQVNGGVNGTQINDTQMNPTQMTQFTQDPNSHMANVMQNRRMRSKGGVGTQTQTSVGGNAGGNCMDMEDFKISDAPASSSSNLIDLSTPPAPGRGRNVANTVNMTEEDRKKFEKERREKLEKEKEKERKKEKEKERNRRKLMQSRQCAPGSLNNIPVSKTGKKDGKNERNRSRNNSNTSNGDTRGMGAFGGGTSSGLFQQGGSGRSGNSTANTGTFFSGSSLVDQHRNSSFSFFPELQSQDTNVNMGNPASTNQTGNSNGNTNTLMNRNCRLLGTELLNNLTNPNAIPRSLQEQQQRALMNELNTGFSSNDKYGTSKNNSNGNDAIASGNSTFGLQFEQLLKMLSDKSKQMGGSLNIHELMDKAILDSLDPRLVEALQLGLEQQDAVRSAVFSGNQNGGNGSGGNGNQNGPNPYHGAFGVPLQQLNEQFMIGGSNGSNQFQHFRDPNQLPELGPNSFGQNTKPPVDHYLERAQNLVPNPYFPKGAPPPLIEHEIRCIEEIEGVPVHFKFGRIMEPQLEVMRVILRACGERKHALCESPTGTGKTAALITSALAYQQYCMIHNKPVPQIVYACRTHDQGAQVADEIRNSPYGNHRVVQIGSRQQLCVNWRVNGGRGAGEWEDFNSGSNGMSGGCGAAGGGGCGGGGCGTGNTKGKGKGKGKKGKGNGKDAGAESTARKAIDFQCRATKKQCPHFRRLTHSEVFQFDNLKEELTRILAADVKEGTQEGAQEGGKEGGGKEGEGHADGGKEEGGKDAGGAKDGDGRKQDDVNEKRSNENAPTDIAANEKAKTTSKNKPIFEGTHQAPAPNADSPAKSKSPEKKAAVTSSASSSTQNPNSSSNQTQTNTTGEKTVTFAKSASKKTLTTRPSQFGKKALSRHGTALSRQATGGALSRQGTTLSRQGTTLSRQGTTLSRQGTTLSRHPTVTHQAASQPSASPPFASSAASGTSFASSLFASSAQSNSARSASAFAQSGLSSASSATATSSASSFGMSGSSGSGSASGSSASSASAASPTFAPTSRAANFNAPSASPSSSFNFASPMASPSTQQFPATQGFPTSQAFQATQGLPNQNQVPQIQPTQIQPDNVNQQGGFHHPGPVTADSKTIWPMKDLKDFHGPLKGACPFYASHALAGAAHVVVCPHQYVVDPAISSCASGHRRNWSLDQRIVIVDEAHNVEDLCRSVGSFELTGQQCEVYLLRLQEFFRDIEETQGKSGRLSTDSKTGNKRLSGEKEIDDRTRLKSKIIQEDYGNLRFQISKSVKNILGWGCKEELGVGKDSHDVNDQSGSGSGKNANAQKPKDPSITYVTPKADDQFYPSAVAVLAKTAEEDDRRRQNHHEIFQKEQRKLNNNNARNRDCDVNKNAENHRMKTMHNHQNNILEQISKKENEKMNKRGKIVSNSLPTNRDGKVALKDVVCVIHLVLKDLVEVALPCGKFGIAYNESVNDMLKGMRKHAGGTPFAELPNYNMTQFAGHNVNKKGAGRKFGDNVGNEIQFEPGKTGKNGRPNRLLPEGDDDHSHLDQFAHKAANPEDELSSMFASMKEKNRLKKAATEQASSSSSSRAIQSTIQPTPTPTIGVVSAFNNNYQPTLPSIPQEDSQLQDDSQQQQDDSQQEDSQPQDGSQPPRLKISLGDLKSFKNDDLMLSPSQKRSAGLQFMKTLEQGKGLSPESKIAHLEGKTGKKKKKNAEKVVDGGNGQDKEAEKTDGTGAKEPKVVPETGGFTTNTISVPAQLGAGENNPTKNFKSNSSNINNSNPGNPLSALNRTTTTNPNATNPTLGLNRDLKCFGSSSFLDQVEACVALCQYLDDELTAVSGREALEQWRNSHTFDLDCESDSSMGGNNGGNKGGGAGGAGHEGNPVQILEGRSTQGVRKTTPTRKTGMSTPGRGGVLFGRSKKVAEERGDDAQNGASPKGNSSKADAFKSPKINAANRFKSPLINSRGRAASGAAGLKTPSNMNFRASQFGKSTGKRNLLRSGGRSAGRTPGKTPGGSIGRSAKRRRPYNRNRGNKDDNDEFKFPTDQFGDEIYQSEQIEITQRLQGIYLEIDQKKLSFEMENQMSEFLMQTVLFIRNISGIFQCVVRLGKFPESFFVLVQKDVKERECDEMVIESEGEGGEDGEGKNFEGKKNVGEKKDSEEKKKEANDNVATISNSMPPSTNNLNQPSLNNNTASLNNSFSLNNTSARNNTSSLNNSMLSDSNATAAASSAKPNLFGGLQTKKSQFGMFGKKPSQSGAATGNKGGGQFGSNQFGGGGGQFSTKAQDLAPQKLDLNAANTTANTTNADANSATTTNADANQAHNANQPHTITPTKKKKKKVFRKNKLVQLTVLCMSPSVVFSELTKKVHSIILASGTLHPAAAVATELGVEFSKKLLPPVSANHIISRNQLQIYPVNTYLNAAIVELAGPNGTKRSGVANRAVVPVKAEHLNARDGLFLKGLADQITNLVSAMVMGYSKGYEKANGGGDGADSNSANNNINSIRRKGALVFVANKTAAERLYQTLESIRQKKLQEATLEIQNLRMQIQETKSVISGGGPNVSIDNGSGHSGGVVGNGGKLMGNKVNNGNQNQQKRLLEQQESRLKLLEAGEAFLSSFELTTDQKSFRNSFERAHEQPRPGIQSGSNALMPRTTTNQSNTSTHGNNFNTISIPISCLITAYRTSSSEGMDLKGDKCRMVICTGIPYTPYKEVDVSAKMQHNDAFLLKLARDKRERAMREADEKERILKEKRKMDWERKCREIEEKKRIAAAAGGFNGNHNATGFNGNANTNNPLFNNNHLKQSATAVSGGIAAGNQFAPSSAFSSQGSGGSGGGGGGNGNQFQFGSANQFGGKSGNQFGVNQFGANQFGATNQFGGSTVNQSGASSFNQFGARSNQFGGSNQFASANQFKNQFGGTNQFQPPSRQGSGQFTGSAPGSQSSNGSNPSSANTNANTSGASTNFGVPQSNTLLGKFSSGGNQFGGAANQFGANQFGAKPFAQFSSGAQFQNPAAVGANVAGSNKGSDGAENPDQGFTPMDVEPGANAKVRVETVAEEVALPPEFAEESESGPRKKAEESEAQRGSEANSKANSDSESDAMREADDVRCSASEASDDREGMGMDSDGFPRVDSSKGTEIQKSEAEIESDQKSQAGSPSDSENGEQTEKDGSSDNEHTDNGGTDNGNTDNAGTDNHTVNGTHPQNSDAENNSQTDNNSDHTMIVSESESEEEGDGEGQKDQDDDDAENRTDKLDLLQARKAAGHEVPKVAETGRVPAGTAPEVTDKVEGTGDVDMAPVGNTLPSGLEAAENDESSLKASKSSVNVSDSDSSELEVVGGLDGLLKVNDKQMAKIKKNREIRERKERKQKEREGRNGAQNQQNNNLILAKPQANNETTNHPPIPTTDPLLKLNPQKKKPKKMKKVITREKRQFIEGPDDMTQEAEAYLRERNLEDLLGKEPSSDDGEENEWSVNHDDGLSFNDGVSCDESVVGGAGVPIKRESVGSNASVGLNTSGLNGSALNASGLGLNTSNNLGDPSSSSSSANSEIRSLRTSVEGEKSSSSSSGNQLQRTHDFYGGASGSSIANTNNNTVTNINGLRVSTESTHLKNNQFVGGGTFSKLPASQKSRTSQNSSAKNLPSADKIWASMRKSLEHTWERNSIGRNSIESSASSIGNSGSMGNSGNSIRSTASNLNLVGPNCNKSIGPSQESRGSNNGNSNNLSFSIVNSSLNTSFMPIANGTASGNCSNLNTSNLNASFASSSNANNTSFIPLSNGGSARGTGGSNSNANSVSATQKSGGSSAVDASRMEVEGETHAESKDDSKYQVNSKENTKNSGNNGQLSNAQRDAQDHKVVIPNPCDARPQFSGVNSTHKVANSMRNNDTNLLSEKNLLSENNLNVQPPQPPSSTLNHQIHGPPPPPQSENNRSAANELHPPEIENALPEVALPGSEWYSMQAFRALNQALGRAIRGPDDYAVMILLDSRWKEKIVNDKLSKWLRPFVVGGKGNGNTNPAAASYAHDYAATMAPAGEISEFFAGKGKE